MRSFTWCPGAECIPPPTEKDGKLHFHGTVNTDDEKNQIWNALNTTLSAIAKRFYGNANDYIDIFNANKDQLTDPDQIKPGQVLKVPQHAHG